MLNEINKRIPKTGTIDGVVESIVEICINFIEEPFFAREGVAREGVIREGLSLTIIDVFGESIASLVSCLQSIHFT